MSTLCQCVHHSYGASVVRCTRSSVLSCLSIFCQITFHYMLNALTNLHSTSLTWQQHHIFYMDFTERIHLSLSLRPEAVSIFNPFCNGKSKCNSSSHRRAHHFHAPSNDNIMLAARSFNLSDNLVNCRTIALSSLCPFSFSLFPHLFATDFVM